MKCERCTGLVVADHFIGGGDSISGWVYRGWRCVNCGAIGSSGKAEAYPVSQGTGGSKKNSRQSVTSGTNLAIEPEPMM